MDEENVIVLDDRYEALENIDSGGLEGEELRKALIE